jgi:hypothetical protein
MVRQGNRLAVTTALAAALLGSGCGLVHRPYTNDPILREHQPVWGDHAGTRGPESRRHEEPVPPQAPPLTLPAAEGWADATSR